MGRESVLARVRRISTHDRRELGILAQELEETFPELVRTGADGWKRVDYIGLIPVLIDAIKELEARVAELESAADGGV